MTKWLFHSHEALFLFLAGRTRREVKGYNLFDGCRSNVQSQLKLEAARHPRLKVGQGSANSLQLTVGHKFGDEDSIILPFAKFAVLLCFRKSFYALSFRTHIFVPE